VNEIYEYLDEPDLEGPAGERPRDPKTDEAKAALRGYFEANSTRVFYERQLIVMFEQGRRARPYLQAEGFFHWITVRALNELVGEGFIRSVTLPLWERVTDETIKSELEVLEGPRIRFFWSKRARYVARQAEAVRMLVTKFSTTEFGRALGRQGEAMFDAALPTKGFLPKAWNVRAWDGRAWTETEHNLDRVFERDGIAYGTEIKNRLEYIDREEVRLKLRICGHLGLRPLFIVRMAPKSYIEQIRQAGGYTLVVEWQLYPYGTDELARRVRDALSLPVDCPARIADGTVQRFLKWHLEEHGIGM
jgi:hypothetical protein